MKLTMSIREAWDRGRKLFPVQLFRPTITSTLTDTSWFSKTGVGCDVERTFGYMSHQGPYATPLGQALAGVNGHVRTNGRGYYHNGGGDFYTACLEIWPWLNTDAGKMPYIKPTDIARGSMERYQWRQDLSSIPKTMSCVDCAVELNARIGVMAEVIVNWLQTKQDEQEYLVRCSIDMELRQEKLTLAIERIIDGTQRKQIMAEQREAIETALIAGEVIPEETISAYLQMVENDKNCGTVEE